MINPKESAKKYYLSNNSTNMLSMGLMALTLIPLVGLHKDKDVINTHSKNKERNYLKNNERGWNSNKSKSSLKIVELNRKIAWRWMI